MTLEEIKALSDRELDAKLAEKVLGWSFRGFCYSGPVTLKNLPDLEVVVGDDTDLWEDGSRVWYFKKDGAKVPLSEVAPPFSSSLDAIAPLEAKTVEKFGVEMYEWTFTDIGYFDSLLLASARHRAEACLFLWTQEGE